MWNYRRGLLAAAVLASGCVAYPAYDDYYGGYPYPYAYYGDYPAYPYYPYYYGPGYGAFYGSFTYFRGGGGHHGWHGGHGGWHGGGGWSGRGGSRGAGRWR